MERGGSHLLIIHGEEWAGLGRQHRGAGVTPAMPVSVPAFFEERRQVRRRGNLKGRSTDATGVAPSDRSGTPDRTVRSGRCGGRRNATRSEDRRGGKESGT